MRRLGLICLLAPFFLHAQNPAGGKQPDLGLGLCWNNDAEARLVHDATLLSAVGRALALSGRFSTIGVRSEPCAKRMPDAACFGVPGGIMCQGVVIERQLRAASWAVEKYTRAGRPAYEKFRRANAEAVAYGFQFADGARLDAEADRLRASLTSGPPGSNPLVDALVDYNLASLLGHELAHTNDAVPCVVEQKSSDEDAGLWQKIIRDELDGAIFVKHNADPDEIGADRCGLRHVRLLNGRMDARLGEQTAETRDFIRRFAADMVAFQLSFGWRRFNQLPGGKYAIFSQDQYLYAPYRATLFAAEVHGSSAKPAICGYAAEIIVQAVQNTYTKTPGRGDVDDDFLAMFPRGVETSWNGAPWTPNSFTCEAPGIVRK